jgi:hypothetical protein
MFSCFFGLKNVFPTVKILTFSRGEFKYVQMDQGLRLRLNSSFINSPRLKVKILTVGKSLIKSKMHQISKFLTFFKKNVDHKHHQLSSG